MNSSDDSSKARIPGPEIGYVDLLDIATEDAIIADAAVKRNPIRPSSAGLCTRELAYKLMEFTGQATYDYAPITPEVHRVFSSGHALEYDLVKQFEKHCKEFFAVKYKQVPLDLFDFQEASRDDLKLWVEGSNDLCFVAIRDGWRAVVDIKTKKDKFSSWSESSWSEMTARLEEMETVKTLSPASIDSKGNRVPPKAFWVEDLPAFLKELNDPFFEANFLQLNCYAHADFMKRRGIDHGVIVQYNKNDQRLREIRFRPSQALFEKVKEKFNNAIAAADKGDPEAAPRDYLLGSMKCAFCDFKKECYAEPVEVEEGQYDPVDPMKEWFKTLPPKFWARSIDYIQDETIRTRLLDVHARYKAARNRKDELEAIEAEFAQAILDSKQYKIKFSKGEVYEAKHLKSPKPHIALRRTKEK